MKLNLAGALYTYDAANRLSSRTWARRVDADLRTAYSYNSAGDLSAIDYSDSTPDVSFTYDRIGRQKTASSSVSAHTFAYSGLLLDSETIVRDGMTNVIDRSYDSLGRPAAFTLNPSYAVQYAYDSFGRLHQISNFQFQAAYSYLPDSDLLYQRTMDSGLQTTFSYEQNRNLLTQVKNKVDAAIIKGIRVTSSHFTKRALGSRLHISQMT